MAEAAEDTPEKQPDEEPGDNSPSTSQISETPHATARPDEGKGGGGSKEDGDRKEYRAGNCNDCNRQFCLDYMNLPICKGKGVEEIFTTCFRQFLSLGPIPTVAQWLWRMVTDVAFACRTGFEKR